jgi:hypothetical protein
MSSMVVAATSDLRMRAAVSIPFGYAAGRAALEHPYCTDFSVQFSSIDRVRMLSHRFRE